MNRKTQKSPLKTAIYQYNLIKPKLSKAGLTPTEMMVLSEICLLMQHLRARKICGAYIAKRMGKSKQWINTVIRKLEKIGLIIRLKNRFTYLHLNKCFKTLTKSVSQHKQKSSKWLKTLIRSRWVINHIPITSKNIKQPYKSSKTVDYSHEKSPMIDYIPLHLRKTQT